MIEPLGYGDKSADGNKCQSIAPEAENHVADIIVLDDAALGFRFCTNDKSWLEATRKGNLTAASLKACGESRISSETMRQRKPLQSRFLFPSLALQDQESHSV